MNWLAANRRRGPRPPEFKRACLTPGTNVDGCCLKKLDGTGRFEVVVLKKLAEKGLLGAGHGRAIRARRTKESILGPAESCLGEVQPSVTKAWFLCGDQERLPLSMRYEGKRRRPVILTGYFVQSTAPQRSQIMNDALLSDCWKEPRCRYRDSIDVATVKDAEVIAQPRPGVELALPLPPTGLHKEQPYLNGLTAHSTRAQALHYFTHLELSRRLPHPPQHSTSARNPSRYRNRKPSWPRPTTPSHQLQHCSSSERVNNRRSRQP